MELHRVERFRVNRIKMPMGNDSSMAFALNHNGVQRMVAICFDPSDIFDIEVVDVLLSRIINAFQLMVQRMTEEEAQDAVARSQDPTYRDTVTGAHLSRAENGDFIFTPAYIYHKEECGYRGEET